MAGRFNGAAAQPGSSDQADSFAEIPRNQRETIFDHARDQPQRYLRPLTIDNPKDINRRHLRIEELLAPAPGRSTVRPLIELPPLKPLWAGNPSRAPRVQRFAPYPQPTGHQPGPGMASTSRQPPSSTLHAEIPSHARATIAGHKLEVEHPLRPNWHIYPYLQRGVYTPRPTRTHLQSDILILNFTQAKIMEFRIDQGTSSSHLNADSFKGLGAIVLVEHSELGFGQALNDPHPQRRGKSSTTRAFRSCPILPVVATREPLDGTWFGKISVESVMIDGPADRMALTVRVIQLDGGRDDMISTSILASCTQKIPG